MYLNLNASTEIITLGFRLTVTLDVFKWMTDKYINIENKD